MRAEPQLVVRSWPVGGRTCTLTVRGAKPCTAMQATAEWSPDAPTGFTPAEWTEYRAGRHRAFAEIAAELGVTVAVVEV